MASTSKVFKKCVDPCPRYLTPDDTHNLCVFCLGKEHACDVLEGKICVYYEPFFYEKAPLSSVPLFEERGAVVCFPQFGTHCCRGTEADGIMGFAVGSGRWVREGPPLFARRPRTRVSCWIVMMQSFWCHQIQRLVPCCVMPRKSRRCLRARKLRLNPLNPPALHMTSYWRLWIIK